MLSLKNSNHIMIGYMCIKYKQIVSLPNMFFLSQLSNTLLRLFIVQLNMVPVHVAVRHRCTMHQSNLQSSTLRFIAYQYHYGTGMHQADNWACYCIVKG